MTDSIKNKKEAPFSLELKWSDRWKAQGSEELSETPGLPPQLFYMYRRLERLYRDIPWPAQLKRVTVMTEVQGGRGDISAAAKAIAVMRRFSPDLEIDWVVLSQKYEAEEFLIDKSNVHIYQGSHHKLKRDTEFLITGPVNCTWGNNYIGGRLGSKVTGPRFDFLENACKRGGWSMEVACDRARKNKVSIFGKSVSLPFVGPSFDSVFNSVFNRLFVSEKVVPMGLSLKKKTGVFVDDTRRNAKLSRKFSCPTYLAKLRDKVLHADILQSFGGKVDYDKVSLNSGYAHHPRSWGMYIDFVAVQERNKDVTIVLNQHGEFTKYDTKTFAKNIFGEARLALLNKWGYGHVVLKGDGDNSITLSQDKGRRLTVIIRPSFHPDDMKHLQLASERLLATGDNTAVEAWAARCKLYLYEDVANMGCKGAFLQQQINLAKTFHSGLGELLKLGGKSKKLTGSGANEPLSKEEMDVAVKVLLDPKLPEATYEFCRHITTHFSFAPVLEAALKRTAWHHIMPELKTIEANGMSKEFRVKLMKYLGDCNAPKQIIPVDLSTLKQKIQASILKS